MGGAVWVSDGWVEGEVVGLSGLVILGKRLKTHLENTLSVPRRLKGGHPPPHLTSSLVVGSLDRY